MKGHQRLVQLCNAGCPPRCCCTYRYRDDEIHKQGAIGPRKEHGTTSGLGSSSQRRQRERSAVHTLQARCTTNVVAVHETSTRQNKSRPGIVAGRMKRQLV